MFVCVSVLKKNVCVSLAPPLYFHEGELVGHATTHPPLNLMMWIKKTKLGECLQGVCGTYIVKHLLGTFRISRWSLFGVCKKVDRVCFWGSGVCLNLIWSLSARGKYLECSFRVSFVIICNMLPDGRMWRQCSSSLSALFKFFVDLKWVTTRLREWRYNLCNLDISPRYFLLCSIFPFLSVPFYEIISCVETIH